MELKTLQNILMGVKRFAVGNGIYWQFNDTTITINGAPVTQYLLYHERETGFFVIMTTHPLEVAEDYFVTVQEPETSPYTLTLTPRYSKHKALILKEGEY